MPATSVGIDWRVVGRQVHAGEEGVLARVPWVPWVLRESRRLLMSKPNQAALASGRYR